MMMRPARSPTVDGYMLDTTEFNALVKGHVPISSFTDRPLFATHVQLDELNSAAENLRPKLRAAF
jgi:hypothetical protein